MFDYHMHSIVSFDGHDTPEAMVQAALDKGLKEICFTDHIDHEVGVEKELMVFDIDTYNEAYDWLEVPGLKIRRGMEFGIKPGNQAEFRRDLELRHFDFVIGSVHFVDEMDVYLAPFWEGRTKESVYLQFMEETLKCVQAHDQFDVLGHLTYISKCRGNPTKALIRQADYRELTDEIMKVLAAKGKGMEMNTSGVDRCGDFLPDAGFFRRFKELGGEIVTVGSDAHTFDRVGQHTHRACEILSDIFGYVCTFEDRKPIFHKL
ncbi:MAG: histidinol-phosphatase HisJ family protein [Oscillospiraceae bacterium]|nr:histidinol-phosphatase HisJ family protein [Oscillospiraceae bacterium]